MIERLTDQEVIAQAIQIAIDNGFSERIVTLSDYEWRSFDDYAINPGMIGTDGNPSIEEVIYNHDFAKALWPKHNWSKPYINPLTDQELCGSCKESFPYAASSGWECWQEHLQQMVIAEDPIHYLRNNL